MHASVKVLIFICLVNSCLGSNINALEVETKQGILKGKHWESRKGRIFNGFTGIPFAEPPIGDLRFKDPVPMQSWTGVLDATKTHNVCPQISIYLEGFPILGNEDCLYLNVYTPALPISEKPLLPVMFYIHGGSFILGSAKPEWLGPELLLDEDIVLVTTNYRLGSLGFLSTADDVVPGNTGLKDQSLALRWVKDNIANFGGDPERITVFGNSAGAVSAHFHMFSPLSRNLISGVIIQSGTVTSTYALTSMEESLLKTRKLGKYLNCSFQSTDELINCLRIVDMKEIITQEARFLSWDNETTIPFRPVIENTSDKAFLIEHPLETLKSGKVANVPIMVGVVAQEAAYKAADFNSKPHLLEMLNKYFHLIVPPSFSITSNKLNASKAIREFYFGTEQIDNTTISGVTDMYSDGWYTISHDVTVRLHKEYSRMPIYQYLFDYKGSTSYSTLFGDGDYGVCHTDELLYLFKQGMIFPNYIPTKSDKRFSEVLLSLWTNFARTGNPNLEAGLSINEQWNPIQRDSLEYYHIKNYTNMEMKENLFFNRINFWKNLLNEEKV